ncbi:MAG: ferrous iron transport protein A [Candidatus Bathyarchaeota archaeon]|nr:ferrous iron transport protein A [Candidatus Bathyarchaeota archaeon]
MQLRRKDNSNKPTFDLTEKLNGDVPLTSLSEGDKATVTHAIGGLGAVRRLSEMGLTPGCEITLKRKCSFRGPIEIEVRGVCLALGYGLASMILVQPLDGKPN